MVRACRWHLYVARTPQRFPCSLPGICGETGVMIDPMVTADKRQACGTHGKHCALPVS